MSGLFDEKRTGGATRRDVRTQKEKNSQKKTRTITIAVISVLIVVFVGALIINSSFIRRSASAITIDGVSFSVAEFDYFYNWAVFEYTDFIHQNMPDFAGGMLPNRERPFASQIQDTNTNATWADFFVDRAITNMSGIVQLYNAARASGFEMSDENIANMEAQFNMLIHEGELGSARQPILHPTPMSYLQAIYGNALNEATLRRVLELTFTAWSYSDHVRESLAYTQDQLEAFYMDNADAFDIFRYRMLMIEPEIQDPADFTTGDELADAQDEAEAVAAQRAEEIIAIITSEEDFIAAALMENPIAHADPRSTFVQQQGEFLNPQLADWLADETRQPGDITSIEVNNAHQIVFFIERDTNNYHMAEMRQLLFLREDVFPEDFADGEDDPEFIAASEAVEADVRARGEAALAAFEAGGSLEQVLIDMIPDFSDDPTEGGFYDNIARAPFQGVINRAMQVVPELEDWLFDPARQAGDFELVRTEAFGYHLMFFAGHGEQFNHFIARERLQAQDHMDWRENLPEVTEIERHWAFTLTDQR